MKEKIGIYSDSKREIEYEEILSLYKISNISLKDLENTKNMKAIILDVKNNNETLQLINKIRAIDDTIPLIWIIDFEDHLSIHDWLKEINGVGRVETMCWFGDKAEKLIEKIELCIHPYLPVKREEIAIVIPIYNEEERFEHVKSFVSKIKQLKTRFRNINIYFIDDGSNDQSMEMINKLIDEDNEGTSIIQYKESFKLETIEVNTRKAGTYIEAFKHVNADVIVFADADDGYEIEDIVRMINLLNQGYYDIVIGTKDLIAENRPPIRRFISFCKRAMTKPLLPKGITDSQTGLKVFTGSAANMIVSKLDTKFGFAIDLKILSVAKKMNFRMIEMPVRFYDREGSHVDVVKDSISFVKSIIKITLSKK